MQSRDFVFWLQGFFEISNPTNLSEEQVGMIKNHLALVFRHDASLCPSESEKPMELRHFFTDAQSVSGKCSSDLFTC